MKLLRDLNIVQDSAWDLSHLMRAALLLAGTDFTGRVELDETYLHRKRENMLYSVRKELKVRGPVRKTAVAGATNQARAGLVQATDEETLQGSEKDHSDQQATLYTDEAFRFEHESVKHSVSEYLRGQAQTDGVESFRPMLQCEYYRTFRKFSPMQLARYLQEFAGRHKLRERDTIDPMGEAMLGMDAKRLKYDGLIRDNGLDSGARGRGRCSRIRSTTVTAPTR